MKFWRDLNRAVELLRQGEVVGVPTETVYGLAASIQNEKALEKIFRIKSRPYFDPLIVHTHSEEIAKSLATEWPLTASMLAKEFWPGPMTLVLPKSKLVSDRITAGLPSLGVRIPAHPFARRIAKSLGHPFAAPSANMFGKTSPTTAAHVRGEFSENVFVVDGGPCRVGIESTVIEARKDSIQILRPGMIGFEQLEAFFRSRNFPVKIEQKESEASPGHLKTHYQPQVPLILADDPSPDSSTSYFLEKLEIPKDARVFELDLGDDPFTCARELYGKLRMLSPESYDFIFVKWKREYSNSSWTAIRDRLMRAAQFKV